MSEKSNDFNIKKMIENHSEFLKSRKQPVRLNKPKNFIFLNKRGISFPENFPKFQYPYKFLIKFTDILDVILNRYRGRNLNFNRISMNDWTVPFVRGLFNEEKWYFRLLFSIQNHPRL